MNPETREPAHCIRCGHSWTIATPDPTFGLCPRCNTVSADVLTKLIPAVAAMFGDVAGRMCRRASQQAKSAQATPEKLRQRLTRFIEVERSQYVEAVLPSVQFRLTMKDSPENVAAAAEKMAIEHIAAFEALIRGVLEAPAEDFHAELNRVLARWEIDRPETVRSQVLEEDTRWVLMISQRRITS